MPRREKKVQAKNTSYKGYRNTEKNKARRAAKRIRKLARAKARRQHGTSTLG